MTVEWLDVEDTTPRVAYVATASQTLFTVPFVFFENSNLLVYQNDDLLTLDTDYTVTGAEDEDGGTVTLVTGASASDDIVIVRDLPIEQTTHFPPSGPFDIAALNFQFSRIIAMMQWLRDQAARALHFSDSDTVTSGEIASVADRKNKLLGFDDDGELIYPLGPDFVGDVYDGVAFVDSQATAMVTTFPISVTLVRTGGLATPGDGLGGDFIRGLVSDFGSWADAGGVYWKPATVAALTLSLDGPRAYPSGYTQIGLRPHVVQHGAGPNRVTLSLTPASYSNHRDTRVLAATSVVYVDAMNGSDGNPGTSALPFETLLYAAATSQAQVVRVRAGRYAPPKLAPSNTAYSVLGRYTKRFILEPEVVIADPGPRLQDQTWTVHSGDVYKTTLTLTGAQTVQRVARRDLYDSVANQPLTFTQYANAAALVAATGVQGWAIDTTAGNKVIYIRLTSGDNVETFKTILKAFYLDTSGESRWLISGVPCLIQAEVPGTVLFDGVGIVGTDDGLGNIANVYVDGIVSRFAPLHAFELHGGINYVARCHAHAPLADCFNYNSTTTLLASQNIEIDCRGTNAGDIATFGTAISANRNGSSAHDLTDIWRIGGWYEGNWGPQVADIANAATGTSWNIGVICGPTTEPQSIGFFTADAGRVSYYDMCHAYGNTTAISAATGTAKSSGSRFEGNIVGTLGTYNPATGL